MNIIFHEIFQLKTTFGRRPLEDDFHNFGFEDKERAHIFSWGIAWSPSGGGVLRTKFGPEHDNPLVEINTMPCVQFGLFNCWMNVQLPSRVG